MSDAFAEKYKMPLDFDDLKEAAKDGYSEGFAAAGLLQASQRLKDYVQGWTDRDKECPLPEAAQRCAEKYVKDNP